MLSLQQGSLYMVLLAAVVSKSHSEYSVSMHRPYSESFFFRLIYLVHLKTLSERDTLANARDKETKLRDRLSNLTQTHSSEM